MKKRPTDFSQITLLSNQKAKLIYLKNSKENNEHVKLCKSFELAKHGIKASHGKKKKDLEKRLERHNQDSLNVDDIKCLRKFVGDARDENEFCSQFFEAGRTRRTRSSAVSHHKKGQAMAREISKQEARNNFISDLGKNMESIPNELSKLQTNFPKQDNTNYSTDMLRMGERESNAGCFAKSCQAGNNNHTRTCPEETTDAQVSKTRSPKVQRENIVKQNRNEMLSGLTASSAKPNMISLHSKETAYAGAAASEMSDENNNSLEGRIGSQEENSLKVFDSENQEKKVYDTEASTDGDQSQVSCESKESGNGNEFGQQICEQRKESKKGPVILKRLGPTPNECEEDVEEGTLQDERDGATERQSPKKRTASLIQANDVRNLIEKPRETFPVAGNDPPTRRRRSSWAGPRSITERLFKREFPEALRHLGQTHEAGNGVGRPGLDNSDRASNDDCASTAGELLMSRRTSGCTFLQKSNSVPLGLGSRPKIYSEEPFYMRPRRLSRRPSWQSTKLSEDTLKGLHTIADKAKSDNDEQEPETPLVSILPPITLQSIYAQQYSKEKREQDLHERKQRGTHRKMEEKEIDLDVLSERLKDCRYLRFKKDPSL